MNQAPNALLLDDGKIEVEAPTPQVNVPRGKAASFPLTQIRRFRGKKIDGVEITDDDLLASSVEARPELEEPVNILFEQGFNSSQIIDQALENQDFFNSPELNPLEEGLVTAFRAIGPQIGGLIGDSIDLIQAIGDAPAIGLSKIPGLDFLDPRQRREEVREKQGFSSLTDLIPRTQDLKEKFDQLTENKFSPVDEADAQIDEIIGDFAALALPSLAGKAKAAQKAPNFLKIVGGLAKSLIRPTAQVAGGQAAKQGIEALGGDVTAQEAGKFATMFLMGLRSPGSADRFQSELQQSVRERIPSARVSGRNLLNNLNELEQDLRRGTGAAFDPKKPIFKRIRQIKQKINNGQINLRDIEELIKENNEIIGDPSTLKGTERRIKATTKFLNDAFDEFRAFDPQLVADFREANATTAAVKNTQRITRFILEKEGLANKAGIDASTIAAIQFRSGRPLRGLFTIGVDKVAAPINTLKLIGASPSLTKFYAGALKAAAENDAASYIKNLKALDKGLKEAQSEFGDELQN